MCRLIVARAAYSLRDRATESRHDCADHATVSIDAAVSSNLESAWRHYIAQHVVNETCRHKSGTSQQHDSSTRFRCSLQCLAMPEASADSAVAPRTLEYRQARIVFLLPAPAYLSRSRSQCLRALSSALRCGGVSASAATALRNSSASSQPSSSDSHLVNQQDWSVLDSLSPGLSRVERAARQVPHAPASHPANSTWQDARV